MFSAESIRMASVKASKPSSVICFSLNDFQHLLSEHRDLALVLEKEFSELYKRREIEKDQQFYVDQAQYLALIAHNKMKPSLMQFVQRNKENIRRFALVATGTTGRLLYQETGLLLSKKVKSGPLGGDQAIGQMYSTNNITGVIFFRDPLSAHPHHADIEALGRLCDVYQIPYATNPNTAAAVLDYLTNKLGAQKQENTLIED